MLKWISRKPTGTREPTTAEWVDVNKLRITLGDCDWKSGDTIWCVLDFGCGVEIYPKKSEVSIKATKDSDSSSSTFKK